MLAAIVRFGELIARKEASTYRVMQELGHSVHTWYKICLWKAAILIFKENSSASKDICKNRYEK